MHTAQSNFKQVLLILAIVSLTLVSSAIFTSPAMAANGISHTINFQGRLVRNDSGNVGLNVANNTYSVVFTFYNNGTVGQGTALWTETQTVTTADGIFRVALGSVTPIPANFNFNWDGLYLGIKVGADTEMTPRITMAAVPFAFNAQQVAGLTIQDSTSGAGSTSATLKIGNATTPSTVDLGANNLTFTTSGATTLTLPTSGTLVTTTLGSDIAGNSRNITALAGLTINAGGAINSAAAGTLGIGTSTTTGLTFGNNGVTSMTLNFGTSGNLVLTKGATALSCAGNANGGKLTTDASGNVSCADDTSGSGGGGTNYFGQTSTGLNYIGNTTTDFAIGGNSTASADFAFTGMNSLTGQTQASFSGQFILMPNNGYGGNASIAGNLTLGIYGTGAIQTANNQLLTIGGNTTGDIQIKPGNSATSVYLGQNGSVGIGTTNLLAALDVRGNSGTLSVASVSGQTSFAALVANNNSSTGDIFTASASGTTRFTIRQDGSILMQGQIITSIGTGGTNTTSGAVTNAIGDQGSMVPNAGFESAVSGFGLADGWIASATNGATQVISRVATTSAKGLASIQVKLNASQMTAFYSTCMPIAFQTGLGSYNISMYAKSTVANKVTVRGYLDSYPSQTACMTDNATGRVIAVGTLVTVNLNTTSWTALSQTAITAPAATTNTWAKVHVFVGNPASGTAATVVNIDAIRLIENALTGGLDYAENYPANPENIPEAGDVVSVESGGLTAQVVPTSKYMDSSTIGVVSTNPGYVLDDGSVPDPKVPVALSGRVPVKVSTENGLIKVGDYLASSDIPGVAVKATMAGPVIGTAMENYIDPNPQSIGKIFIFVKNTYFNGVSVANSSGLNLDGKDSSVILAMVKDSVNSNNSISLSLTKDGKSAIKDGNGNSVITFDNQGNAYFKGLIVADKIKANAIEGLDIFANRISALEAKTAVLADATGSAELATASASLPQVLTLDSLNIAGLATVSADLNVGGNGFIRGALNILDSLTTKNLLVSQFAYFINDVVFKGNVRFNGVPTFNNDTAGFAVVKRGLDTVQINFGQEYANTPVVTASIALDKTGESATQKTLEDEILGGNISYVITQRTTKSFVVRLNKPAAEDINFSWVALSVQDAKTSGINLEITPAPVTTTSAAFQSILDQLNNSPSPAPPQ